MRFYVLILYEECLYGGGTKIKSIKVSYIRQACRGLTLHWGIGWSCRKQVHASEGIQWCPLNVLEYCKGHCKRQKG